MVIGIDVDNTINTLTQSVLDIYNADSGDNLTLDDVTEYYMEKFIRDNFKDGFTNYFVDKRVWKNIKVIDGSVEYITKLVDDGHELFFVTSTEPQNVYKKSRWLSRHFPMIDIRKRLIVCHYKQLVSGLDVLIDDYDKNLTGGNYKKIMLNYPWNKSCTDSEIVRVDNWADIYKTIQEGLNG